MLYFSKSFFRISLLLILITTIALLCAVTLSFNVEYFQSIGLDLISEQSQPQGPWGLLLSSLVPMKPADGKPRRLSNEEKEQFKLTQNQEEMEVGLLLGDLCARKYKGSVNARLEFKQGIIHEGYLLDLYEQFKELCPSALR